MKQFFENPYGKFYDLEEEGLQGCLLAYWKGFYELSNPEAMLALTTCLDYVAGHQIKVLISDHSKVEVLPQKTLVYLDQIWYPQVIKDGLKVEIYVDSEDFTGSLSIEEMFLQVNEKTTDLATIKVKDVKAAQNQAQKYLKVIEKIGL